MSDGTTGFPNGFDPELHELKRERSDAVQAQLPKDFAELEQTEQFRVQIEAEAHPDVLDIDARIIDYRMKNGMPFLDAVQGNGHPNAEKIMRHYLSKLSEKQAMKLIMGKEGGK